jgi:hypothetical protein
LGKGDCHGAVLPADQHEDVVEQASRLLRAYFFCAFECQNEGSLATHSAAGMEIARNVVEIRDSW